MDLIKHISIIITIILTVVLPLIFLIFLFKKDNKTIIWAIIGILTFFIVQILIRIPILNYLTLRPWFIVNISSKTYIYAIILALSAALFEEGGRFLSFKFILRGNITWFKGIAFGIGHGAMEAFYFVGLPYIKIYYEFFNGNNLLSNISAENIILAGTERTLAIIIHIALSLIVLYSVKKKEYKYLLYAFIIHTLINLPIIIIKNKIFIWSYLIIWTLMLLNIIFKYKKKMKEVF
ncbi:MAG: YhfC family glutamic-type intramembrane protease [Senegalia sp. (in: firmicutes)]